MDHRGTTVVVTGASSGIGRETALAFAERGATVVAVARREALLAELAEACRAHAPASGYIAGDLGERTFAEAIVERTAAEHGRVDVLVNSAALPMHKQIYDVTGAEVERLFAVNFLATVHSTLAAIPHMLAAGSGTIVNVSSFSSKVTPPREAAYAAGKAAMDAFTYGLWNDLDGSGIHAGLVVPGPIDTEIWDKDETPSGYDGKKYPPSIVVDAIFEVVERRKFEIVVPKASPQLIAARTLAFAAPSLLRAGMKRMEPVPADVVRRARDAARRRTGKA